MERCIDCSGEMKYFGNKEWNVPSAELFTKLRALIMMMKTKD